MLNYDGFVDGENHKIIMKILKIISEKTDYKPGDTKLIRNDDRSEYYITGKPRKRKESKIGENYAMNWVDNSDRWKEFPKRQQSLTFSNLDNTFFGNEKYQIIPFKNVKIGLSMNGDFNYAWKSDILDTMKFDLGLSYINHIGEGVLSSLLLEQLLFRNLIIYDQKLRNLVMDELLKQTNKLKDVLLNSNDTALRICNLIAQKIILNVDLFGEEISNNSHKNLIGYYLEGKGKNKKWNTYYQFIDYIMSPEINNFKILDYVKTVELNFDHDDKMKEYWIDGEFIMVNLKTGITNKTIMDYIDDYLKE